MKQLKPRKIFSFDGESNGLHGHTFAIGAVVLDAEDPRKVLDRLRLRCPILFETDPWVKDNVLPALEGWPAPEVGNPGGMAMAFAQFFKHHVGTKEQREQTWVVADCPWPVESRFLNMAVELGHIEPFGGPYPLIDASSVMVARGWDPLTTSCAEVLRRNGYTVEGRAHNPEYDAYVSGLFTALLLNSTPLF